MISIQLKKRTLKKLIKDTCSKAVFSANKKLYQQIDGISMGSSLGPLLANIIMTELERTIIKKFIDDKIFLLYELDPDHFLFVHGLAWKACLKKTEVRLELLIDVDMLLMVEKGIRGRICHAIHSYAKANNKHVNNYDKNKEL